MHLFHHLDLAILHQINQAWANPFFDWLMPLVSDPSVYHWPIGIGAAVILFFGRFKDRAFLALLVLAVLIGDGVIVNYGKKLVDRPRPNEAIAGLRVVKRQGVTLSQVSAKPGGRSFPSGHTCNNVALAFVACAVYGRRAGWVWLWAALMGYSRIYLAAHYPSDVFFSTFLSIAYCCGILALARRAWARWAPRRPDLLPLWGKGG